MMELSFENQNTTTYLVYTVQAGDELDTMSLGMLTNNHIPGFATASFMQMDTTKYIKYNVSAKVSVSQLFSGPVNKKRLVGVFSGIVDAMLSAEDYMIDPATILLDLDYIFADVSTCETVMVCLPVFSQQQNQDLGMFFKNIIFCTQFDQTENCDHVAQIINYLNSAPVLNLADFKNVLSGLTNSAPKAVPAPQPVQQKVQPQVVAQPQPVVQPKVQPVVQPQPVVQHQAPPMPRQNPNVNVLPRQPDAVPAQNVAANEEKISMMYLLQHYNKENAAKYKAQQEAKKAQKAAGSQKPAKAEAPKKEKKVKAPATAPSSAAPGFAIPGQQPQMPGNMAIPGRQPAVPQQPVAPQQPVRQVQPVQPVQPQVEQPIQVVQPAAKPINFGETMVLSGGVGETSVLSGAAAVAVQQPYLIRVKNSEKIPLNKPVFRIGKERSYVDYFVGDNTAVSRSHANIINHNGEFFVVDTNSTNHTYVNGGMIQSNVETKLSHGTKIRLANEEFEFKLY